MNVWLEILVALTIAGSVIVASIMLLRRILSRAYSAKFQYWMSKTALIFFLFPVAFIMQQISSSKHIITDYEALTTPNVVYLPIEIGRMLFIIWSIGALAFSIWQLFCFYKFNKKIKRSSIPLPHHHDLYNLVEEYKQKLRISSKISLAYQREMSSPVLIGLLKPTILLPYNKIAGLNLGMIIHHELIHLKRKDLWVKMLGLVASAIHWFNPFVHKLRKDIQIWSELSCDEEVVKEMSYAQRKRYGETLLNLLHNTTDMPASFTASLSESGAQLKQRLIRLVNVKRNSTYTVVITFMITLTIGALGTITAAWAANYTPDIALRVDQTSKDTSPIEYTVYNVTADTQILQESADQLQPLKVIHIDNKESKINFVNLTDGAMEAEEVIAVPPTRIKVQE